MRGPTPGRIKSAFRRLCRTALGVAPTSAHHAERNREALVRELVYWCRGAGARRSLRAYCARARVVLPPERWACVQGWLDAALAAAPSTVTSGYGRSPLPWR